MSKALYNSVELPVLPEWCDESSYAILQCYTHSDGSTSYNLYVMDVPFVRVVADGMYHIVDSVGAMALKSSTIVRDHYAIEEAKQWPEWILSPVITMPSECTLWSNHDIYNDDDSLFFEGSDPVLVKKGFDLRSWLTGYALGLAGKPLPISTGEVSVDG